MTQAIHIFDTTLRDGGQCRGRPLTVLEKTELGMGLQDLGVDILEAGFPRLSQTEFDAVRSIASACRGVTVAALAPADIAIIEHAAQALEPAATSRLHIFIGTAETRSVPEEKKETVQGRLIEQAVLAVRRAVQLVDEVQFSPHDATRLEPEFLISLAEAVIEAGASVYNVSDSLGTAVPEQMTALLQRLMNEAIKDKPAQLGVHCHNDLGLAAANSLAALQAGARQVECTLGGIGDRAGNTALEEIVHALQTRPDAYPFHCSVELDKAQGLGNRVLNLTGYTLSGHKAVIGSACRTRKAEHYPEGFLDT